jgi:hypothetical protein
MRKPLLPRCLFSEIKKGPDILQEYRWTCNICHLEPNKHYKEYSVLKSHCKGVTTGMGDHLKAHGITKDKHNTLNAAISRHLTTTWEPWSGAGDLLVARLTPRQSMRRWFVKSRQALLEVETPELSRLVTSRPVHSGREVSRRHLGNESLKSGKHVLPSPLADLLQLECREDYTSC